MLTQFEHFALTSLMGKDESPPRANGSLCFANDWERSAFGIALALAKQGYFEWDDFRDELIVSIKRWEDSHRLDDASWDYYEHWLAALERAVVKAGIAEPAELGIELPC
jgi:nitrile hydratase accessory protein